MAFDPDEYLTEEGQGVTFDPDAYLDEKTLDGASTSFDADAYLQEKEIGQEAPQSVEPISQEPEGFVENAKFIADDFNNQFNNTIANLAGAPVDLILSLIHI